MTPDEYTLCRRAVLAPTFRWLPGMLAGGPLGPNGGQRIVRVLATLPDGETPATERGVSCHSVLGCRPQEVVPRLSDPATLGCLLGLVREAHGVGSVVYLPQNGGIRAWRVVTFAHGADWLTPARLLGEGDTEAEALVAALEAAP